jgi:hypothetical protein
MDNFWIFLVIAGAIISFARKEDKARKKQGSAGQMPPQETPKAELERQLREIFGGETPARPTPKIKKEPAMAKSITTTPVHTPKKSINTPKADEPRVDSSANSGQIGEIVKDFSMEKAVIYSEILKPKWEE